MKWNTPVRKHTSVLRLLLQLLPPPAGTNCYFKQPVSESVIGCHQNPSDIEFGGGNVPDNQQHWGSSNFTIESTTLNRISENKDIIEVGRKGGVDGIGVLLKSDLEKGIQGDDEDISSRVRAFGENCHHGPPKKGAVRLVYEALRDPTILFLLICAALSLGLGIKLHGPRKGCYDGVSILVAALLFGFVTGITSFRQTRKLEKTFENYKNNQVTVLRNGNRQKISISDIVVGDVICLFIGDQVPADGLFINGSSFQVDESSISEVSGCVGVDRDQNPFLYSGAKVVDGCAKMLVTSVGMNTKWGKRIHSRDYNEETQLQKCLNKLVLSIVKVGRFIAFLVFVALMVRYFTGNMANLNGKKEFNGDKRTKDVDIVAAVVRIISDTVAILVVAIPTELPLAVMLSRAFSMKMLPNQARVRNPSACDIMGSVTTICTDITGTLSSDQIKVTESYIGKESMQGKCYTSIESSVLQKWFIGISLTSNKLFSVHDHTDDPIHSWAVRKLNMETESMEDFSLLRVEGGSSYPEDKRIGILHKKTSDKTIHVHWRDRAENILSLTSHYYDAATGDLISFDDEERESFHEVVKAIASSEDIHCLALAHKRLSAEEYENIQRNGKIPDDGLILLGLVGIKYPCQPGVKVGVEMCQLAGVEVKMITGENVDIAEATARKCGIVRPGNELVVERDTFRRHDPNEQLEEFGGIGVMARSSTEDKLLVVQHLKARGHIVALISASTRDTLALKAADIALSMGTSGTKESSDIIILDDNFKSFAEVLKWGRCLIYNVKKCFQFQLTISSSAPLINFVAASSTGRMPITPAQLLWVNLIMGTLGALAVASEKPSEALMKMLPEAFRSDPFITNHMWRNIISQALYQAAVILVLFFKSKPAFAADEDAMDTLVFTTFVLLQVFNLFNTRRIEEKNVFEGILENKMFSGVIGATIILQVVMVEFLCKFAHTKRLDLKQWGFCVGIASFSWLVGFLAKFIPTPNRPMSTYVA